jgi:hypothetical protein
MGLAHPKQTTRKKKNESDQTCLYILIFDLTKCYCSTGLIFYFYSNRPNARQQINPSSLKFWFFQADANEVNNVNSFGNAYNDRELIESPFGTVGQFRLGIRSVTEDAMFKCEFIKCPYVNCCVVVYVPVRASCNYNWAFQKILFSTLIFIYRLYSAKQSNTTLSIRTVPKKRQNINMGEWCLARLPRSALAHRVMRNA